MTRNDPNRSTGLRSPVPALRHAGFTLLEVLAAIALLSIAFAIGLGALGKTAQNAGGSAALDTAVERAQSLLAAQGLAAPLKNESLSGSYADGLHWTLNVHAVPQSAVSSGAAAYAAMQQPAAIAAQAPGLDLYQLDVAVQYGDGRTLRLSTQRAQAAGADGRRESGIGN